MSDVENIVQAPSTISTSNEDSTLFAERKRELSDLIGGIFKPPLGNSNEDRNSQNSKVTKEGNSQVPEITKEEKLLDIPTPKKESDWHISISPDGENILKFNHHVLEFKVIPKNNLQEEDLVPYKIGNQINNEVNNEVPKDNFPKWMIAISNSTKEKEVLVAISRVTRSDMMSPPKNKSFIQSPVSVTVQTEVNELKQVKVESTDTFDKFDKINSSDERNIFNERNEGKTVIYKINLNSKSGQPIYNDLPGGIVKFVHNKDNFDNKNDDNDDDNNNDNDFHCFIFNASGICRKMFTHDLNHKKMEQFYYPRKLQNELYTLYRKKPCLTKLYNSIFDHYFFIEQYKEGIQVLQLYDLRTMELKQIFNLREEKSIKKFGTPIFARSVNGKVIAFSTGFGKLFFLLKMAFC
ncbi:hypothetical protein RclHR1_03430013 [Rhizophagus clarus]|uniref:Uncharacterized protein n=1 Tax=Rhizophagus clarus TaxID=94130 RepID=A0A2Z6RDV8_9GLOM|nr:hypothetical protein RclHR1_03430013 [Rhizophagus clarus]